jgi:methylmalonyl-CoA carboxyltransferase large subunit
VGLGLADFIVIVVLVASGCLVCSIGLWVMMRQAASAQQHAMEGRLNELTVALKALEAKVAELGKIQEKPAAPVAAIEASAPYAAAPQAAEPAEEVTPEMLVVIAAAVTAFLGKRVRIRSAKMVRPPREAVSAWSQHGRALVHSSHNPRARA